MDSNRARRVPFATFAFFVVLVIGIVLGGHALAADGWQVYDTPIGGSLTVEKDKVSLKNQSGAVRISGSTIGTLRIAQNATGDTLVVSIDSSKIGRVEVEGSVYLRIAPEAVVEAAFVEREADAFIDGVVPDVSAAENAYVQIIGSVERLSVSGSAFVDVLENASTGSANFTDAAEEAAVLNIATGGVVRNVSLEGNLMIGGQGFVNEVATAPGASVNIDATITREDGIRTTVSSGGNDQIGYIDDEKLVMSIEPVGNLSLTGTTEIPLRVVDLMGYEVGADVSVKSSDSGVVADTVSGNLLRLERKGDGKAVISVTATLDGYRDAK